MTTNSKLMISLFFALMVAPFVCARPVREDIASAPLIHRLKLDEQSPGCWDSLVELQACSGELILFFMNGETYIGDGCCHAIRSIAHKCWPNMLGTLGFTAEEGDILQGYCDHEAEEADEHSTHSSSQFKFIPNRAEDVSATSSSLP